MLTKDGIFVCNLVSKSRDKISKVLDEIESQFTPVYTLENCEDLHKVMIACNNQKQRGKTLLKEYFQRNHEIFTRLCNIGILNKEQEKLMPKLIYRRESRITEVK